MNFFELAVGLIGNLFVAGIAVGFLIVAVLPRRGGPQLRGR
jgi:hypothetical protein